MPHSPFPGDPPGGGHGPSWTGARKALGGWPSSDMVAPELSFQEGPGSLKFLSF